MTVGSITFDIGFGQLPFTVSLDDASGLAPLSLPAALVSGQSLSEDGQIQNRQPLPESVRRFESAMALENPGVAFRVLASIPSEETPEVVETPAVAETPVVVEKPEAAEAPAVVEKPSVAEKAIAVENRGDFKTTEHTERTEFRLPVFPGSSVISEVENNSSARFGSPLNPVVAESPAVFEEPQSQNPEAAARRDPAPPPRTENPAIAEVPTVVEKPIAVETPVVVEKPAVAETPVVVEKPAVAETPVIVEKPSVAEKTIAVENRGDFKTTEHTERTELRLPVFPGGSVISEVENSSSARFGSPLNPVVAESRAVFEEPQSQNPEAAVRRDPAPPPRTENPAIAETPVVVEKPAVAEAPAVVEKPIAVETPFVVEKPEAAEAPAVVEKPSVAETPVIVEKSAVAEKTIAAENRGDFKTTEHTERTELRSPVFPGGSVISEVENSSSARFGSPLNPVVAESPAVFEEPQSQNPEAAVRRDPAPPQSEDVEKAAAAVQSAPVAVAPPPDAQVAQPTAGLAADPAVTARTAVISETVNQIVEAVADQIFATPALVRGDGNVRIVLKPAVLDGSEISMTAKDGTLSVAITPATPESGNIAAAALPRLETALAEHVSAFRSVSVAIVQKKGKANEAA